MERHGPEHYATLAREAKERGDLLEAARLFEEAASASLGHKRAARYEDAARECRGEPEPTSTIGEPYYFAIGQNAYGYGNDAEEAIQNVRRNLPGHVRSQKTTTVRVFGPCLDAHEIGCSFMDGRVSWKTKDADGADLPEVKSEDREVRTKTKGRRS